MKIMDDGAIPANFPQYMYYLHEIGKVSRRSFCDRKYERHFCFTHRLATPTERELTKVGLMNGIQGNWEPKLLQ